MKHNVGTVDRAIRALVGIAALVAWYLDLLEGTPAIIALVVGVVTDCNRGAAMVPAIRFTQHQHRRK